MLVALARSSHNLCWWYSAGELVTGEVHGQPATAGSQDPDHAKMSPNSPKKLHNHEPFLELIPNLSTLDTCSSEKGLDKHLPVPRSLSLSLSVSLLLSSLGCHSTCARIGGSLVLGDQLSGDAAPVDHLDLAHGLQHLSVRTAELLDVGRQKSHPLRLGHFDPVANVEGPTVRPHTSDREQSGNPKLSSQFCA